MLKSFRKVFLFSLLVAIPVTYWFMGTSGNTQYKMDRKKPIAIFSDRVSKKQSSTDVVEYERAKIDAKKNIKPEKDYYEEYVKKEEKEAQVEDLPKETDLEMEQEFDEELAEDVASEILWDLEDRGIDVGEIITSLNNLDIENMTEKQFLSEFLFMLPIESRELLRKYSGKNEEMLAPIFALLEDYSREQMYVEDYMEEMFYGGEMEIDTDRQDDLEEY